MGHNFGDISFANRRTELVPSLSAKIKHHLGIENPFCVAYDLPFGCPGWLQGLSRPITICVREMPNWPWLLEQKRCPGFVIPMIGIPCCMLMEPERSSRSQNQHHHWYTLSCSTIRYQKPRFHVTHGPQLRPSEKKILNYTSK